MFCVVLFITYRFRKPNSCIHWSQETSSLLPQVTLGVKEVENLKNIDRKIVNVKSSRKLTISNTVSSFPRIGKCFIAILISEINVFSLVFLALQWRTIERIWEARSLSWDHMYDITSPQGALQGNGPRRGLSTLLLVWPPAKYCHGPLYSVKTRYSNGSIGAKSSSSWFYWRFDSVEIWKACELEHR